MNRDYSESESLETKNILNKFKDIGFVDYKQVKKEILKLDTITDKLDYLKEIKENYYDKYLPIFFSLTTEEQVSQKKILESIFGTHSLWDSLKIQKTIYDEFFRELLNNDAEYNYWFIKFDAKQKLQAAINSSEYLQMTASNESSNNIKAELKVITDLQEKARQLSPIIYNDNIKAEKYSFCYEKSTTEKPKWNIDNEETELIQIIRILSGNFYKNNIANRNSHGFFSEIYFKHILYKEHLEELLGIKIKIIGSNGTKKTVDELSELIRHEQGKEIINKIKTKYKNIKGKELKLLLLAFQELELLQKNGIGSKFHKFCKKEFKWDIGSITAMNKYKFNDKQDKKVLEEMINFIKKIIISNKQ